MARRLKVANNLALQGLPRDSRGRIAVWLVAKKKWAWRSAVDVREIVGMGQGSIEAPPGSPPKPTPDNPFGDSVETDSEFGDDDDNESSGESRS